LVYENAEAYYCSFGGDKKLHLFRRFENVRIATGYFIRMPETLV
jgi:hypothetical protein